MSYKKDATESIEDMMNEDDRTPTLNWDVFLLGGLGGGIGAMLGTLIFPVFGATIGGAVGGACGTFVGRKINDLYN